MVTADKLVKLAEQKSALKAAIETVAWQITSLEKFHSKQQVNTWKYRRRNLKARLKEVSAEINALEKTTNGEANKNIPRGAR